MGRRDGFLPRADGCVRLRILILGDGVLGLPLDDGAFHVAIFELLGLTSGALERHGGVKLAW